MEGRAWHFRKLRDHAVLELTLKREWRPSEYGRAIAFASALALWALIVWLLRRRRRTSAAV